MCADFVRRLSAGRMIVVKTPLVSPLFPVAGKPCQAERLWFPWTVQIRRDAGPARALS